MSTKVTSSSDEPSAGPRSPLNRVAVLSRGITRRELWLLSAAVAIGLAVRIAYVLATRHYALAGDSPEYDREGQLIAQGHLFWTRLPYGILHAGAWKAPG